jgi:hypothetical protein
MGINLKAPSVFPSATLIGDTVTIQGGSTDTPPQLTKNPLNNNLPVSAALEVQSTLGGFLLPRMTAAQKLALNSVDGMMVYDTDIGSISTKQLGQWGEGLQKVSVTLTAAQVIALFGASVPIIPPPGVGKAIIVDRAVLVTNRPAGSTAFGGGAAVRVQYGINAAGGGVQALTGDFASTVVTSATSTLNVLSGFVGTPLTIANLGLYISNITQAFTNGANSTIAINVWYSIISSTF